METNKYNNMITIHNLVYIILIILNIYFYNFCKLIKKNALCLEKQECKISNKSRRVYVLKNISFFLLIYIVINFIIPINKYILKIPLISSIYSLILLIILICQLSFFLNIINILNSQKCLDCLGLNNLSKKIINLIIKNKYKILVISILSSYIIFTYI